MSTLKKTFMLLLPVAPFLVMGLYLLERRLATQLPDMDIVLFVVWLLSILSVILYIRHVWRNDRVAESDRMAWVVGFVLATSIAQVVYWFRHINKKKA